MTDEQRHEILNAIEKTYADMVLFREWLRHKPARELTIPKKVAEQQRNDAHRELVGMIKIAKLAGLSQQELDLAAASGEDEGSRRYWEQVDTVRWKATLQKTTQQGMVRL